MATKLFVWSDYATWTGFSNVMSHILRRLPAEDFEIDVCAVNYFGNPDYDRERFPGRIWPAFSHYNPPYNDLLGRQKVIDLVREGNYDTLFILQDVFNTADVIKKLLEVKRRFKKWFKIVYYFPVDIAPRRKWITESVSLVDIPVAYTQYGARCCVEADPELIRLSVVPHGIDPLEFYPIDDEAERESFRHFWHPGAMGKTLLSNINRNQPRKDIPRSLLVLKELKMRGANVGLYLHMSNDDAGGDLTPIADQLGLLKGVDYFMPQDLDGTGYPITKLNMVYNMSDIVMTTTMGEGWGLSITEAMAAKRPVIAPDHTSIPELIGTNEERGFLAPAGNKASLWACFEPKSSALRPLTSVEGMASKIQFMIEKNALAEHKVNKAYEWVCIELNWNMIVKDYWLEFLSV